MKPHYIDIHSHINFPEYDIDRELVLLRMKETNTWTITVGTNTETSLSAIKLAEENESVFACVGLHPIDDPHATFDEPAFIKMTMHPKVVAIGECGLDFGRKGEIEDQELIRQKGIFESHINLAVKYDKPLMLHVRNAHEDVLDILEAKKKEHGDILCGNSHFFTGSVDIARRYLDLGFTVSFTGVITFTSDYDEVIKFVPLESMMVETDSPYVAPVPFRGQRNEPIHVNHVVKRIAELKNLPLLEVREAMISNVCRSFKFGC